MPGDGAGGACGLVGSPAWFRENVARTRPEYAPRILLIGLLKNPATRPSATCGSRGCGYLSAPASPLMLPVLVMVSSHSRFIRARNRHRTGDSYAAGVAAFAGVLATRIVQVKPYDPESKGVAERLNQFLETSFLPGRSFASKEDFNAQLAGWLPKANARLVRRTGAPDRPSCSPRTGRRCWDCRRSRP